MEAIIELQIYYFTHHQNRKVLRFSNVHDSPLNLITISCQQCCQTALTFRNFYIAQKPDPNQHKVNNRNTRTRCEICLKLTTIKTPERRQRRSGVFIVNFEHISQCLK